MSLTNLEAEEVMSRQKRITQALVWKNREQRDGYEMEAAVGFLDPSTGIWELGRFVAVAVPERRVRCVLMYRNIAIRRLCDARKHRNPDPDGTEFSGFHKHRWDETDNQRWAYLPEGIHPQGYLAKPDVAVTEFLEECQVAVLGARQPLLV